MAKENDTDGPVTAVAAWLLNHAKSVKP